MPKVAIITDTHFGARDDSIHMQANQKRFLDDVFFPTIDERGIEMVWHGGDYVDRRKYVNFNTAQFIYDNYRTPLRERKIHEFALVGNHDIFFRQTNEVNALRELYRDEPYLTCISEPVELMDTLFVPWINDDNRDRCMRRLQDTKCSVVLGHFEIAGFQMYRGVPSDDGLSPDLFDRFELVMSGHYHHRSSKGPIQYLGAPWAMIWSDYRDPRGFHIFDTDTKQLEFIENPYSLFARIVYDDVGQEHDYIKNLVQSIAAPDSAYHNAYIKVVVKSRENPFWFDLMMDALNKVSKNVLVIDDIIVNDEGDEEEVVVADIDTLSLIGDYVESLSLNADKAHLLAYMRLLYQKSMAATSSARLS